MVSITDPEACDFVSMWPHLKPSEIGGKEASAEPNREIGFVLCSCRACVRAKLCERGREVLLNAGGSNGKKFDSGATPARSGLSVYLLL